MKRRKFIIASLGTAAAVTAAIGARIWNSSPDKKVNETDSFSELEKQRFFSPHQYDLVAKLASYIVPSDDTPGAEDANVASFIDQRVAESRKVQRQYTKGLGQLDEYSQSHGDDAFLLLTEDQQYEILEHLFDAYYQHSHARHNRRNSNFLTRKAAHYWQDMFGSRQLAMFLGRVRRDTLEGFYSHPLGWEVAGYYGPPQPLGYPNYSSAPENLIHPGQIARNNRSSKGSG